jgi:ADP-ribosyl-[dinitrogen reductase] hydrolase
MRLADSLPIDIDSGFLPISKSPLFATGPRAPTRSIDFNRVQGMMIGLAIGDSLGYPTEGSLPEMRRRQAGEITDYCPHPGVPSDDTQLAFWTLEQLIEDRGFVPDHLAASFTRRPINGIGHTVSRYLRAVEMGASWREASQSSAGNGALMRIAPMLIPHLRAPSTELWVDCVYSAAITHRDSAAISSAVAFVALLWELLHANRAPEPSWWCSFFCALLKDLELGFHYEPRSSALKPFRGSLWQLLEQEVPTPLARDEPFLQAANRWYSGAYLLETVPCVLYLLSLYANDPEQAIVRAVNDTKDNDTIAAITGAALGALHGIDAFPKRWRNGLSGRTTTSDDGRIWELLSTEEYVWAPASN